MTAGRAMYPTLDAYYAADERRLRSEEADYGVHWRPPGLGLPLAGQLHQEHG